MLPGQDASQAARDVDLSVAGGVVGVGVVSAFIRHTGLRCSTRSRPCGTNSQVTSRRVFPERSAARPLKAAQLKPPSPAAQTTASCLARSMPPGVWANFRATACWVRSDLPQSRVSFPRSPNYHTVGAQVTQGYFAESCQISCSGILRFSTRYRFSSRKCGRDSGILSRWLHCRIWNIRNAMNL